MKEYDTLNKTAVTLYYDNINAPKVTAKGEADIAEEILALAKQHNIPIFENPGLAAFLNTLDLGDEIPRVLYQTVAEIIAFTYTLKSQ